MKEGYLQREYMVEMSSGIQIKALIIRFLSMADPETAAIKYSIQPINFMGELTITSYLDAGIKNADANYNEFFWDIIAKDIEGKRGFITSRTRKTDFDCCIGIDTSIRINGNKTNRMPESLEENKLIATEYRLNMKKNDEVSIYKYAAVLTSLYHEKSQLRKNAEKILENAVYAGFEKLFSDGKIYGNTATSRLKVMMKPNREYGSIFFS